MRVKSARHGGQASAAANDHQHSSQPGREQLHRENERLRREVEDLRRKVAERDQQIADAEKHIVDAEKQIADLERQLALRQRNSTNSSKLLGVWDWSGRALRRAGSVPDIPRIQASRHRNVRGPFNNRATIRENRDFIRVHQKP